MRWVRMRVWLARWLLPKYIAIVHEDELTALERDNRNLHRRTADNSFFGQVKILRLGDNKQ